LIVALTLICRSSYRGVVESLRDLLGVPIGIGIVHRVLQSATQQAGVANRGQDLSGIRVGLHDEIFQGAMPVLAGVDVTSTYCCYLLSLVEHRDANTWGDPPCHGDIFHIQRQCEGLANTLPRLSKGATSRRKKLEAKIEGASRRRPGDDLVSRLKRARQTETQASWLARTS
jgi:hypothetical protein